jgi:SAM-dependent methyltransferase
MGQEINLLVNYPQTKRDPMARAAAKTEEDRRIARRFGRDFFDGNRRYGYGGYRYHPRFWQPVIPTFQRHFDLTPASRVLDVGCGKGFLLHDMAVMIPGITVRGLDISAYAIENAIEDVKPFVTVGNAARLPYPDHDFDVVISINTIHNLSRDDCATALREIERVGRGRSFVSVDAYRNQTEKERMLAWNLTARTVMHVDEWKAFFAAVGYTGDYYWFIP